MLESILQRTLPLVALVGIACGSDSSSSPSCAADTDCKGERVCVEGKCEGHGGSSDGQNSTGPVNICQAYIDMCPEGGFTDGIKRDVAYCINLCETQTNRTNELCFFAACAVETGYCDNEVPGDPQIEDCARAHGWYNGR